MIKAFCITIATLFLSLYACKVDEIPVYQPKPLISKDSLAQKKWVDSLLKNMTIDEKIGQLFMVQAYSNKDKKHTKEIDSLIHNYHIGGLIFMQGTPQKQVDLYNHYQMQSKYPLLMGFDGEWGLSMRLKPSFAYPWNMTLGAIQNDSLIYQVGQRVGTHCKRVGVHINFAPVVDINTNPKNPIIGNRSFGEDKYNVTNKAVAFTKGMQSVGVLANAKHFPGHGDTASDSHKTLPVLTHSLTRLDSIELHPYKTLVNSNLASVMVAHLDVPAFKTKKGLPTSLSHKVITGLLKDSLGFKGLVITDGLNMKGVANYTAADSICLQALQAGNDMLLIPQEVPKAVATLKIALQNKTITEDRLNQSVKKILQAKYWAGLEVVRLLNQENLADEIHTIEDDLLFKKLAENSITLIKNENNLLPLKRLDTLKIGLINLGDAEEKTFNNTLGKYTQIKPIQGVNTSNESFKTKEFNTIVMSFHRSDAHPWKSFKMKASERQLIEKIAKHKKVILQIFTSPYALLPLDLQNIDAVVVGYQNNEVFQSVAAQQIFGALPYKGKLPVSVHEDFPVNTGMITKSIQRLQYGFPSEVGMSLEKLQKIDSVAQLVISEKMAPGMQVLVARKNKVIFEKSYGYFTYQKTQKVENKHLYDLASLTKILGSFPLFIKAYEDGLYQLDSRLGDLIPMYKNSPLADLKVKEMLAHQSGLRAWIPFYKKTLDENKKPLQKWYRSNKQGDYQLKVTNNLYLKKEYLDSIYLQIKNTSLGIKKYRYSGLPFFLFKKMIEKHYNKNMDVLLAENFTKTLGANTLTYNPLNRFKKQQIAPSEIDKYYRHQTLQGEVHDMAAAMFGGINGNAGLFANANDIAKMMQLYLNKGTYGGKRYFLPETFDLFNTAHYEHQENRRGLVFDKPSADPKVWNTCQCNSMLSFGHSGFTGTYTWADPETELIYVFLSNRTYPTMENNALGKNDIRTDINKLIKKANIGY